MVERVPHKLKRVDSKSKPTSTSVFKVEQLNPSGLTQKEWDETQKWFELEGKVDTSHLGS